ncbi:MAG: DUF502 domain-containing protein [Opitutaceae bacterium]
MSHPPLKSIRSAFIAGVVVLAPLAVTLYVFRWLVTAVGGGYRNFFFFFVPENLLQRRELSLVWDFLATVIVLLLVTLLGYLSRYFVARFFLTQAERLMNRVPLISVVYSTVKQIVETFSVQRRAVFEKVVLIQFPKEGSYAMGFLTSRTSGEAQMRTAEELWNVFLPTTPNPTSGYLIMVPSHEVIEMDMTVGEGMKLIISGGSVVPNWPGPIVQPTAASVAGLASPASASDAGAASGSAGARPG